ncbi:hypothetical protein NMG60_11023604 [Bertholletia excelsa]
MGAWNQNPKNPNPSFPSFTFLVQPTPPKHLLTLAKGEDVIRI